MRDTWEQVKDIIDWFWVLFLGIVGHVCSHWDTYIARLIAFVTLVLLLGKLKRFFFPNKVQTTKQELPDEGD